MTPRLNAATTHIALILFLIGLAVPAAAGTITYDVQAYIDGRSLLIFSGSTLQWHNLSFTVPGKHGGNDFPTTITSTSNSGTVTSQWLPNWPGGETGDQYSDIYTPLIPAFPGASITGVNLTVSQARNSLTIYQMPTSGNGYTLILDFDDEGPGGSAWYRGLVTVTTSDPASIPEPGTLLLAGAGVLLIGLCRRVRA